MKRLIVLAMIVLAGYGVYRIAAAEMKTNLKLNSAVADVIDRIDGSRKAIVDSLGKAAKQSVSAVKSAFVAKEDGSSQASVKAVTVYLKHGGTISGKLISKRGDSLTVEWKGEPFVIEPRQISRVEYKTERDIAWPYESEMAIVRTNGVVLDGRISAVGKDEVTVSFPQGGGEMEMTLRRSDIDHILFAPVCTRESLEIEKRLKSLFPKMKMYKDGNITLFTDSYDTKAVAYRKQLRNFYSEVYLKFFRLFNGRRPASQCFVVAFDDFGDYVEYAVTDGVPGWAIVGYFSPIDKTLYVFNAFGERMEKMVFDVMVGKTGKSLDMIVNGIKGRIDSRYHVFLEAQAKEISDKFWDAYNLYKNELSEMTDSTLRHEFTHEIFNNWGLQSVVLSKPSIDKKKLEAKKKEFLDAKDYRKKEELLMGLMKLKRDEYEGVEVGAAQSWLSEGIATYCATDPIGSIDENWLFIYQDAASKREVNPIEFLTNFKVGSFPGLAHKATLGSYAQSWALVSFLMEKYPDQFMAYQIRFATQKPKDGDEELRWLLEAVGKDLPALEKEFSIYMAGYPMVDDPDVRNFMRYYKIWEEILA